LLNHGCGEKGEKKNERKNRKEKEDVRIEVD